MQHWVIVLNYRDVGVDQNNRDYYFCHKWTTLFFYDYAE